MRISNNSNTHQRHLTSASPCPSFTRAIAMMKTFLVLESIDSRPCNPLPPLVHAGAASNLLCDIICLLQTKKPEMSQSPKKKIKKSQKNTPWRYSLSVVVAMSTLGSISPSPALQTADQILPTDLTKFELLLGHCYAHPCTLIDLFKVLLK